MNSELQAITFYPSRVFTRRIIEFLVFVAFMLAMGLAHATVPLQVALHKGKILNLPNSVESIAVANSEIAEVQKLDAKHLYVLGKRIGSTNVVLCRAQDCFKTYEVEVTHDLEALKQKLDEIYPDEHPAVYSAQGSIVLAGQVSSVEKMNGLMTLATAFVPKEANQPPPSMPGMSGGAGGTMGQPIPGTPILQNHLVTNVVNLMQVGGPQQVMLGVTVAEVARSLTRRLTVDFNAFGGGNVTGGAVSGASIISAIKQMATPLHPAALFFNFIGHDATVHTVINAAKENGLAKVLAEPNLTTISGQDAEFVSGGEFPIPVPQFGSVSGTGGGITVQFKEYGVILKFLPVVLNSGRISLKLNIAVSEIDNTNSITIDTSSSGTYYIPSLKKRNAASSMELDDGQTLGIAGLISDTMRETVTKFPGLGDVPILGQLFTSQNYLKNETELMIFVTPHLAKPMDSQKVRLATDAFTDPDDAEFFLMGRTEGLDTPKQHAPEDKTRYGAGLRGHFGQHM
ncbi:MAG: hypothetical protein RLZ25_1431 [Pseudomonadota bacterium]|jgi:pilus assembly protein CpaC